MAKKNYLQKNKDNIFNLLVFVVIFVLLSLIVPAIGASATAPALWVSVVEFFTSVRSHFAAFWMFYSFIVIVIVAYFNKK